MAQLVSVNIGMPRDIPWQGRTVHTGAWKVPVSGPRLVRRLNIDGDGQGDLNGHGGENRAVLVYQLDSYRYWADVLGRDDLTPGMFGENFTVEGLPDDEVCIGDRYRIGDAVFEVTQPRVTCYRAGLRVGEPRMAALLVSHHRPGFYCRVLTEGQVQAGQDIVKISTGPQALTVADMDALLYLPGRTPAMLQRALRIPALSPGWQGSVRQLLAQDSGVSGNSGLTGDIVPPPAWPGFRTLRISDITAASPGVRAVTLADPDGAALPQWRAGQSIAVRVPATNGVAIRNYSLSNAPDSGVYRIGVKREPGGAVSSYIHDSLVLGADLEVAAPRGTFALADVPSPVVLLSAGVGVTPVLSMLHQLARTGWTQPVWWLHAARDETENPFTGEVHDALKMLPHSKSGVYYSRAAKSAARITAEVLQGLALPADTQAYLCGPETLMQDMAAALAICGLADGNIHQELFGARSAITPGIAAASTVAPHLPPGPAGSGPVVSFARSAVSAPWAGQYHSLLEFAEACDVPTRWSCRTGVCHTCETPLVSGTVRYDDTPLDPPADGNVLLCIAAPADDVVVDL